MKIKRKWFKSNLIIINNGEIIKFKIKILDKIKKKIKIVIKIMIKTLD